MTCEQTVDDAHGNIGAEPRKCRLVQGAGQAAIRRRRGRALNRDEPVNAVGIAGHLRRLGPLDESFGDGDLTEFGTGLERGGLGGSGPSECEEPAVSLAAHGRQRDRADAETDSELDAVVALGKSALRFEGCPAGRDRRLGLHGPVRHERVARKPEYVASGLADRLDETGEAAVEDGAQLLDRIGRFAHRERELRESTHIGREDDAVDVLDSGQRLLAAENALTDHPRDEAEQRVGSRHRELGGGGAGGW